MNQDQLIRRAKENDNEALSKLIDSFTPMIYSIIWKYELEQGDYLIPKEDLFQEACIALLEACKSYDFDNRAKFSTYAYVLIQRRINRMYYHIFKVYQNEIISFDRMEGLDHMAMIKDNEFVYQSNNQLIREAYNTLSNLSKEDQAIVQMRVDKKSYKEIADKLGITVKRVDNRLNKIKQRIRQDIK